jgi:hypothetical protein
MSELIRWLINLLKPSAHFKQFSAPSTQSLVGAESVKTGQPCRQMRFVGTGTVTVKRASDAASQTINVNDGDRLDIAATEITSVSGVTAVLVLW